MAFSAAYRTAAALQNIEINYFIEIEGIAVRFTKRAVAGAVFAQKNFLANLAWNPSKIKLDSTRV